MHRIVAMVVAAVALSLAGCGSSAPDVQGAAASTPAAAVTATASPTPTVLTKAQAAQRYLQIVASSNARVDYLRKLEASYNGKLLSTKVSAQYRAAALAYQTSLRKFMADMLATPWPADVEPTAEKVVDEAAPLVSTAGMLAQAQTVRDIEEAWGADDSENAAAQRIRVQLGLPPAG